MALLAHHAQEAVLEHAATQNASNSSRTYSGS